MKLFSFSKLKKLSSYFIELIIVVLGVSIAFQLNVWNDERKNKRHETQLLENLLAENQYNINDMDSSAIDKRQSVKNSIELHRLLSREDPPIDSIKFFLAQLYTISWPSITTTHLDNYLQFNTSNTPLRSELLNLRTLAVSHEELSTKYIDQKQEKVFDYLSDVVLMDDNLPIVDRDKLFSVQFRNYLSVIIAYEQSLADVLENIKVSQIQVDSLINLRLSE